MGFGGSFQKVAEEGFVGPETDSGVLEVDDDGVYVFEVGGFGVLVGGFGAVEADDGEMGGGVGLGGEVFGVLLSVEAVFGGEDFEQGDFGGGVGEDVDGAAAVGIDAGLVGEEGEVEMVLMLGGEGFEGGELSLFEDVYSGEDGG